MKDTDIMLNHITALLSKYDKIWTRLSDNNKIRVNDVLCRKFFDELNTDTKELNACYSVSARMGNEIWITVIEGEQL